MNVAASVRLAKEKHPDRFCSHPRCLWRIVRGDGSANPCRNHSADDNERGGAMRPDQISRRQMLGAGSVLAVGVLLGTPMTLGASPTLQSEQVNALLAILNRPNEAERFGTYYATCGCRDCEGARARPYQCGACGFDGVPLVFPCECGKQWDEFVATNAGMLRSVTGKQWVEIAAFQRRLRRGGRPARCTPGMFQCAHTGTWCPVCGDCGNDEPFEGTESRRAAARMIYSLRTILAQVAQNA